jgi:uncharacterized protein Smg (DUF494 family)
MFRRTNRDKKMLKKGMVRITLDDDELTEKLKAGGYDNEQIKKVFEVINEVGEPADSIVQE